MIGRAWRRLGLPTTRRGPPGGWDVWLALDRREARAVAGRARSGRGVIYDKVRRVGPLVAARRIDYGGPA